MPEHALLHGLFRRRWDSVFHGYVLAIVQMRGSWQRVWASVLDGLLAVRAMSPRRPPKKLAQALVKDGAGALLHGLFMLSRFSLLYPDYQSQC